MRRPFAALLLAAFLSCMAPEAAPGQERIVPRIGAHDGYDRVVIDWPFSVDYDVDVDGREITVRFARMAEIDVAPVVRRLGARVSGVRASAFPGGTALSFVLAAGVQLRHFRNGRSVVLDLARKTAGEPVDPASTQRLAQERATRSAAVPLPPPQAPSAPSAVKPPPAAPVPVGPPPVQRAAPAPALVSPQPVPPVVPAPAPPPPTTAEPTRPVPVREPSGVARVEDAASAPLNAACAGDFEMALAWFSARPPEALAPADTYNAGWLRRMLGDPAGLTGTPPQVDGEVVGACSGRRVATQLAELWRAFPGGRLPSEPIRIRYVVPASPSAAPGRAPLTAPPPAPGSLR